MSQVPFSERATSCAGLKRWSRNGSNPSEWWWQGGRWAASERGERRGLRSYACFVLVGQQMEIPSRVRNHRFNREHVSEMYLFWSISRNPIHTKTHPHVVDYSRQQLIME